MDTLLEAPVAPTPTADVLDALIDQYTENLMRAALSMGFRDTDAEELVQDTFCAYLEGGARFEGRSKLLTYLFGILYNKARSHRRYQDRHESIEAAVDEEFENKFDAQEHWNGPNMEQMSEVETRVQSKSLATWIDDCLESLNATLRMAFTMKEVEGCDTEAICLALGLSPNHLGVTLFRARNKLRDCLTAKGAVIA